MVAVRGSFIQMGDNDSGPIEPRALPINIYMGDSNAVGPDLGSWDKFFKKHRRNLRRMRRRARIKRRGW